MNDMSTSVDGRDDTRRRRAEQPAKPPPRTAQAQLLRHWRSSLARRRLSPSARGAITRRTRETMADAAAAPRLRAQRCASATVEGRRPHHAGLAARHDVGLRHRQHLCARQRLHRQAQCRYRRSGEGRAAAGRDHGAGARSSDRAGARPRSSQSEAALRQQQANCRSRQSHLGPRQAAGGSRAG